MSFSVPRWRNPICGSTRSTTSPSSSSTRRSTPWAAGCCGPKLIVKLRTAASFMVAYSLFRLLIARQRIVRSLPGRQEIEITEFLGEAHGVIGDPLLLVVPTHLDEASERKILAQRVAFEAVVGEEPAHVGMAGERDPVEIEHLALEPVGARKDVDDGGDGCRLVGLDPH